MCTAITFKTSETYFGRTLDLEHTYLEEIVVTPRRFVFDFRHAETVRYHHAIIGMACVIDGYPLYYDAANEHGLAMAGLNFPQNAHYFPCSEHKDNIAPFELIPWILSQCRCVDEARTLLAKLNICDTPFSDTLPLSPLHWMIADRECSIVVESTADGLKIYDDPVGVMTNNPPFSYHVTHLCDYLNVSVDAPDPHFGTFELTPYSRGMGGMGLPGDWSSASRFVRAAFVKQHAVSGKSERESVNQFFHIMDAVAHPRGCVRLPSGEYEITVYTSCVNLNKGIYYYTTYDNRSINAVDLHRCELECETLYRYPMRKESDIHMQN